MLYDLFIHRHNFAVWAAARAVQRGFPKATVQNVKYALEASGIQRFLTDPAFLETQSDRFEVLHKEWCGAIYRALTERDVRDVTYGRVAKLVAIYLKLMVIIGGAAYSVLGHAIHPPIDGRLLKALAADTRFHIQVRGRWRRIRWTDLDENGYYSLIQQLRAALPPEIPFWMLEEYWSPGNDSE